MLINDHTKIAGLLKHDPRALDAIISISARFEKLRNPVLRKLMAGRTSIAMAAKIGGCRVSDFYNVLGALGFEIEHSVSQQGDIKKGMPACLKLLQPGKVTVLDVRETITSGTDPLTMIMQQVKSLGKGHALKIINSFEPVPLMKLLEKQGFSAYTDLVAPDLVETWFYRDKDQSADDVVPGHEDNDEEWDNALTVYKGRLVEIDVRALEMPLPMITILGALEKLPEGMALFVHHKKIPVYLLAELAERRFSYHLKQVSDKIVNLVIFRKHDFI